MTATLPFQMQTAASWSGVKALASVVALVIGAYWLYILYRRTFESSNDPSLRKTTSSRVGSSVVTISGAYYSAVIAIVIAVLSWPTPLEQPFIGGLLVGGVLYHTAVEYREST